MQLNEFIKPNELTVDYTKNQLGARVKQWNRKDLPNNSLFIIGLSNLKGEVHNLCAIRTELYSYYLPSSQKQTIDLGNIISFDKTDQAELLILVMNTVQKNGSVLIILTEEKQNLSFLYGHELSKELLIVAEKSPSGKQKNPVDLLQKKRIERLLLVGVQSYFLNPAIRKNTIHPIICRLGQIRDSIHEIEPCFRMARFAEFDVNALRYSDFPMNKSENPNGLYAEEFCQLAWFAGNSETLDFIALSGLSENLRNSKPSIKLVAQTVWYIISGVDIRQNHLPGNVPENFKEFHLQNTRLPEDLVVYKSKTNAKHWLQYGKIDRFVPCTQKDMDDILNDNINDRLWEAISML